LETQSKYICLFGPNPSGACNFFLKTCQYGSQKVLDLDLILAGDNSFSCKQSSPAHLSETKAGEDLEMYRVFLSVVL
jgi:hypothetical protein